MERGALPEASVQREGIVAFRRVTLGPSPELRLSLLICDLRNLLAQPLLPGCPRGCSLPLFEHSQETHYLSDLPRLLRNGPVCWPGFHTCLKSPSLVEDNCVPDNSGMEQTEGKRGDSG